MDPKLITPILVAALLAWAIVRRLRRTFGRQPVQPARIVVRILILTLVGGMIGASVVTLGGEMLEALFGGLACGAALAWLGLRHTRFEVTPEGRFYTPHTYIGLAVSLLFLGRIAYRFFSTGAAGMFAPGANAAAAYQKSPLTVGIFAVLIGYYLLFYVGVLLKTRSSEAPAAPDAITPE